MMKRELTLQHKHLLHKVPRRTNECWLRDTSDQETVYVCGHRFLLRLEGTSYAIWRLLDGRHNIVDIADELEYRYDVDSRGLLMEHIIDCVLRMEELGLAAWRCRPLFEEIPLETQILQG